MIRDDRRREEAGEFEPAVAIRRARWMGDCYFPFTMEQWVAAVFHVPESLIQVSLQITVRARCVPLSSAS